MSERQQTLHDLAALTYVQRLNPLQIRILKLLALGDYTQAEIGRRLNVSRQYVNQIVKKFEKFNLLQKNGRAWTVKYRHDDRPHREDYLTREKAEAAAEQARKKGISPTVEPTAGSPYNATYSVNPALRKQIDRETDYIQYSNCNTHHIRRTYQITRQSGPVATDWRTGFMKSWEMRGGTRFKFSYGGKAPAPNVTIDVHPGTITVYTDRGQKVVAESIEDAEEITRKAMDDAVALFIEKQRLFGVYIETSHGKQVTKTHYGFSFSTDAPHAAEQTALPGFWIDHSPEANGDPHHAEIETLDPARATGLDRAILQMHRIDSTIADGIAAALPQAMGPLTAQLSSIEAAVCGGITLQQQVNNLTQVVAAVMKQNTQVKEENQQLWEMIKCAFSGLTGQKNRPHQSPTTGGNGGHHVKA